MPTPFSQQCFIVKSFDESKTHWTRHHRNIFPFLISLQDLLREQRKLPLDPSMLIDLPHASNSTYAIYGMSTQASGNLHRERRGGGARRIRRADFGSFTQVKRTAGRQHWSLAPGAEAGMAPDDLLCSRNARPQNDAKEQPDRSSCSQSPHDKKDGKDTHVGPVLPERAP